MKAEAVPVGQWGQCCLAVPPERAEGLQEASGEANIPTAGPVLEDIPQLVHRVQESRSVQMCVLCAYM